MSFGSTLGQAIGQVAQGVGNPVPMGLAGPGGQLGMGFVGQFDDNGNLIPGTGGIGNANGPQSGAMIDPSAPQGPNPAPGSPGLGGKGSVYSGANDMVSPGLGGKGPAFSGANDTAVPVDTSMNLPSQGNIPTPPPTIAPVSGTPGRPVPTAPFTPIGPAHSNPGGQGVIQHPTGQITGTPPIGGGPLTGNFQPSWLNAHAQPVGNLSPQPLGKPPVVGTMNKPNRGIGTYYGPIRGAGRGGLLK